MTHTPTIAPITSRLKNDADTGASITSAAAIAVQWLGRCVRISALGLANLVAEIARAKVMAHVSPFVPTTRRDNSSDPSRF